MESVADNPAQALPLGRVLSEERERQALSRTDVAQRLHMSQWQVEALEAGDYERLPRGMFLRGFVRNYSRLLHLDPEKTLPLLADAAKAPAQRIVVPTQNIRFDPMGERLSNPYMKAAGLAVVAVSLAFAAMYWWLFIRPPAPAAEDGRKPVVVPAQPAGGVSPQQVAVAPMAPAETPPPVDAPREEVPAAVQARVELPKKAEPVKKAEAAPSPRPSPRGEGESLAAKAAAPSPRPSPRGEGESLAAKAPSPRPSPRGEGESLAAKVPSPTAEGAPVSVAPGEKRVRFRFKGDSWVEVRDARGRTLISKLHPAGAEAEVVGRPPLTVVVGNAPEVELTYDDRAFDLQPHSRVGVARVNLQ